MVDKELSLRFEYRYMKPSIQLQIVDKEMLIKSIWLHYVFCALHVELEQ